MACNWDPSKHDGRPCPIHGAGGGEDSSHRKRLSGGKYEGSGDGGKTWKALSKQDYDDIEETEDEFDLTEDSDFEDNDDEELEDDEKQEELMYKVADMLKKDIDSFDTELETLSQIDGETIEEIKQREPMQIAKALVEEGVVNSEMFEENGIDETTDDEEEEEDFSGETPNDSKVKLGDEVSWHGKKGIVKDIKKDEDGFLLKVDFDGEEKYISDFDLDKEDDYDDIKEKPLHIKSLENQVARNPQYKEIADSLTDNKDMNDAYFYAFKDAYEKHNYEPSNKHIADELEDAYYRMQDDYRDRHGMNDSEWDWHGESAFEREYGTMSEFIDNGLEAHNRYFDNLDKPEVKMSSEENRINDEDKGLSEEQIRKTNHIVDYFKAWGTPSRGELQDVVNFYRLTKPMANRVFKLLGIDEEDTQNLKYKED